MVDSGKQHLDVGDESFGNENTFCVGTVANIEKHVGNACGRRFFETRQDAPDLVYFFFHYILLFADTVALLVGRVDIGLGGFQGLAVGCQADIPELVYHITFRVPVLILAVAENLDKLLEDGGVTAMTALSKLRGVVEMAIHLALVLVI